MCHSSFICLQLSNTCFIFLCIQDYLAQYVDDDTFSQSSMANAIYQKLESYWPILDETSQISSLLDPRVKLSAFRDENEKQRAINLILNLRGYSFTSQPKIISSTNNLTNTRNYFRQLRENSNNVSFSSETPIHQENKELSDELEKYLALPLEDQVDPLLWWQVKQREYPKLSLIARDYLSIQATSVASEQAFSIVGQTVSALRNRIEGESARAVLCLKSWIHEIC